MQSSFINVFIFKFIQAQTLKSELITFKKQCIFFLGLWGKKNGHLSQLFFGHLIDQTNNGLIKKTINRITHYVDVLRHTFNSCCVSNAISGRFIYNLYEGGSYCNPVASVITCVHLINWQLETHTPCVTSAEINKPVPLQ